MKDEELMQQALEGLEKWRWGDDPRGADDYIAALRERLAQPEQDHIIDCPRCGHCCPQQPEQEPVAWTTMPDAYDWTFISGSSDPNGKLDGKWHPLYTTPQPAQQGGGNLPPPLEQQPVACVIDGDLYFHHEIDWEDLAYQGHGVELLYTAPQPRQWQGLTHDERDAWQDRHGLMVEHEVIHELDDLLREKNT